MQFTFSRDAVSKALNVNIVPSRLQALWAKVSGAPFTVRMRQHMLDEEIVYTQRTSPMRVRNVLLPDNFYYQIATRYNGIAESNIEVGVVRAGRSALTDQGAANDNLQLVPAAKIYVCGLGNELKLAFVAGRATQSYGHMMGLAGPGSQAQAETMLRMIGEVTGDIMHGSSVDFGLVSQILEANGFQKIGRPDRRLGVSAGSPLPCMA